MDGLTCIPYVLRKHEFRFSHAWDVTYTQGYPPSRPHTTKYVGRGFAGFVNHQAILREVWVVIRGTSCHEWVDKHFTCIVDACMGKVLQAWDITHTHGCPPSRPQTSQDVGPGLSGSAKPPSHQHGSVGCDMRYQWPWMGGHIFLMFCGCMGKVP